MENLEQQIEIGNELEQFIVLLQAIVDWGNAVSSEAQALVAFNSELANLERETGTILESHGISFVEERFGSIGPLGRVALPVSYPEATPPEGNVDRYEEGSESSEQRFDLVDPLERLRGDGPAEPIDLSKSPPLQGPDNGSKVIEAKKISFGSLLSPFRHPSKGRN
jgi:hypothetical protein